MHTQAYSWLQSVAQQYSCTGPVLEIGSININGSARDLWGHLTPYVGVDIVAGPNVDYVVDISDWNVINTRAQHEGLHHDFRTIICTEVLEHVDPHRIIAAMFPYMADTCTVIITAASLKRKPHSADGAPDLKPDEYYKNVSKDLLTKLLSQVPLYVRIIDISVTLSVDETDVYAVAHYESTRI